MPIHKDLKRRVRARMQKTGESYTAARARVLEKKPLTKEKSLAKSKPLAPTRPAAPARELAAVAGMSDRAVTAKTGRGWQEWVVVLDRFGAAERPHRESARHLHEDHGLPGWWAQMITVGYERIRGLREKGQRPDGVFQIAKSRTYPVPVATLWTTFGRCRLWLGETGIRMSKATKPKSMRMRWSDGTPIEVNFQPKAEGTKSQLQLQHGGLATRAEAEALRTFWSEALSRLGQVLAKP